MCHKGRKTTLNQRNAHQLGNCEQQPGAHGAPLLHRQIRVIPYACHKRYYGKVFFSNIEVPFQRHFCLFTNCVVKFLKQNLSVLIHIFFLHGKKRFPKQNKFPPNS